MSFPSCRPFVSRRGPFSIFHALSRSCVTSPHRSNSSTIKSMPSFCADASSMTTSAAVPLSPLSCLQSEPPCGCFGNDDVACQCRRPRFHCRYVYAGVGAEKLGGGSCPNRGPTDGSSSTLSHSLAMVSSHARLHYHLWIFRLRVLAQNRTYRDTVTCFTCAHLTLLATVAMIRIPYTRSGSIVNTAPTKTPTQQNSIEDTG